MLETRVCEVHNNNELMMDKTTIKAFKSFAEFGFRYQKPKLTMMLKMQTEALETAQGVLGACRIIWLEL